MTDAELLDQHHAGSPDAFATIVRRHADWVSGVARRRLNGDAHGADDVVQATFLTLAQRSRSLRADVVLPAWLFQVACRIAARAVRDRTRQARRDRLAGVSRIEERRAEVSASSDEWAALAPILDELVGTLRQGDREAILLRFYRRLTHAEAGDALGIGEEAARKRVERAVDRLRDLARRRGITVPTTSAGFATALGGWLATSSPATAGTVAIATTAAGAGSAGAASTTVGATVVALSKGVIVASTISKVAAVAAAALCLLVTAGGVGWIAWTAANRSSTASTVPTTRPRDPIGSDSQREAVISGWNLKQIALALTRYANGNEQRLPPTLGALLPEMWSPDPAAQRAAAMVFLSPDEATRTVIPPTVTPEWIDANSKLVFLAHDCDFETLAKSADPSSIAMLHTPLDQPIALGNNRIVNVVCVDGTVVAYKLESVQTVIAESKPYLDRAREMAKLGPDERAVQRVQSNQLRIFTAMLMRANRNGEQRFPATLGECLEWLDGRPGVRPAESAEVFLTPADLRRAETPVEQTREWVDANASFIYLAAGKAMDDGDGTAVVLHTPVDKPMRNGAGLDLIVMLFADGHSEAEVARRAIPMIDASKREWAAR